METCHPESRIGRQLRSIIALFGTDPFTYRDIRGIVLGPSTLKTMEDKKWLIFTRKVRIDSRWCRERRVVPAMKQWADEQEEKERRNGEELGTSPAENRIGSASQG